MAKSQNCKFKCFFGILCCLLCIGSLLTKPSVPTTDIPTTTTTTFENPKKNFKTQVKTPGIVARLMGLDSLPDPRKVFRRKEDQKEKSGVSVFYVYISKLSFYVYIAKCTFVTVHIDGRPPSVRLPSQQSLHRQHKGFSKTYRQWIASISMQTDGKPYELRSNGKDSVAQQECKDKYEVLETSKVERSSYPAKRTINSKLSEAEMAFIQQKFMADHGDRILSKKGEGTFGQVLECLDNENLEHLGMMERLLGPLPQHMNISAGLRAEKYFKRSARLDWLEGASSKESTRACFFGILCCLLCIGSLLTKPSVPTTDIPTTTTTTTTFENPEKNFKTQTLGRLMGLDGFPSQLPLHRQHKGFSKTYRQWTALVSTQRDGKPYELQSNRKDSMAQQECKDEYEVLEISKKILSKMGAGTFGQVLECLDNGNLEHLALTERLLGPLPQHMIINANFRAEKYFKRSARLDWLESASSKEIQIPGVLKMGEGTFGQVLECLDNENLEHLAMMERLLGPLPRHMIISAYLPAEKYFKRSARLDWLEGASSKESTRAIWKLPRLQCFSDILFCLLHIGSLPTQPFDPTTDIATTTTTTFENPKKNFKTEVKTPGVVARLMGLDLLPDPRKEIFQEECMLGLARGWKLQRKYEGSLEITPPTGTFGQVLECLDNENLEHLAMMERLLGPLPQHMIIKIFQEECTLRLAGGCKLQGKYEASLEITPPTVSQNCKFKCFSNILCCLLCIGSLLTQPSVPTTDIPTTTTTTFENPKNNFKTEVKTPGVVARLMGLDSLPDPRKCMFVTVHVDGRPPNVIARLMGLDGLPSQQPRRRQHKGFSKTYRQWTASVSSQRDGKPYELRSKWKDTRSKNVRVSMKFWKHERLRGAVTQQKGQQTQSWTFGQVLECLDTENLEHLAMMERLLGPLPQHMIISVDIRAEKYFKRSAPLDWLEVACSKESTRTVWKLPRLQ
ncbi:unnamed protein product [Camellia sinensis]